MKSTYAVEAGEIGADKSSVLVMRGRTRFNITVQHAEIRGTPFGDHYFSLIEANEDKQGIVWPTVPLRFIGDYCLPTIERLAPQFSFKGFTLEDLLRSPLYELEIVRTESQRDTRVTGGDECSYSPALDILPVKTADLPPGCDAIVQFASDQISVADHDPSRGVHGRLPAPDGTYMFFKPRDAAREKHFDRELRILHEIQQQCLIQGETRLSDLQGIVVSGDAEQVCVGVMIKMIPTASYGTDLLSPGCWAHGELHDKWEQQVTATVEVLHAHGIVWGDVNAGNVVIDEASNAWVIDFGGSNNPEFVDDDKAETVEGDWQGVRRLFREWLPKRRAGVPLY